MSAPDDEAVLALLAAWRASESNTPVAELNALALRSDGADVSPEVAGQVAQVLAESGSARHLGQVESLARRAFDGGVTAAGMIFAQASDRNALMSGRPQRFGTITTEHQGELHLAPVDPRVPDEIRSGFGLPSLIEIRAAIDEENRNRARRRAAEAGVSGGQPWCRVWRDPTAAELRARMATEGQPVWADGDELTFVCDRDIPGAIVGPLFEVPMWRVEDLLVLTVRIQRLDEAVLTFGFWPLTAEGAPAFSGRPDPDGRFRGPQAPPAVPTNDEMVGVMETHEVLSRYVGPTRRVSVYRPPGHVPSEALPVVYATDGQFFAPYARRVDAAITGGLIPRMVVVAAHAAGFDPTQGGNLRGMEYFPGFDANRFDNHQRFFLDELSRWAETEFGVSSDRADRVVFGCSDGGAHALAVGLTHGHRFGHVLAFSSGMPPQGSERLGADPPRFQLCAGTLEPQFHLATSAWSYVLSRSSEATHFTERVCGHELIQWVEELPLALARAFPRR